MMTATDSHRRRKVIHGLKFALGLLAIYLIVAYLVMPRIDVMKSRRHPDLAMGGHLTQTKTGLPGDPLNIALAGGEDDVVRALLAAAWVPANALSIRSSVRIAVDTVFNKPDPNAPVSDLYLYGRKEDLAFERPIGHSPRERHHVRLWRSDQSDGDQPLWMGAATHDLGVELSRTTGEVTHHIAADVDAERDLLLADLAKSKRVSDTRWITGFHQIQQGRNGGGDPWHTDGRLPVVTLSTGNP